MEGCSAFHADTVGLSRESGVAMNCKARREKSTNKRLKTSFESRCAMATKKAPAKGNKRSVTKKQHSADYYPIQRNIALGVDGGTFNGTTVGDAGKILSITNRRLYRYGKMYSLKIDLDVDVTVGADTEVEVYALANIWDIQRAYALAKKTFDEAYADERALGKGQIARWSDFRITHGVNSASDLDPVTFDRDTLALTVQNEGEHAASVVDVGGTVKSFTWGGSSASVLSVLEEWDKAGNVSNDPQSFSTTAPYAAVNSDDLNSNEMEALAVRGDNPPYAQSTSGDIYVRVATLYYRPGATGMSRLSTGFFDAPCGTFVLKTNNALANGSVRLTAKSGDYKGVMALDMAQE